MLIHFHIHYYPNHGETLLLYGSAPETGYFQESQAVKMLHRGDGYWELTLELSGCTNLEYRYLVGENGSIKRREWGKNHELKLPENVDLCSLYDFWQPETDMSFLYSSAYTDSILAIDHNCSDINYLADQVVLKVQAPFVRKGQSIGLSGNIDLLGQWDASKALKLKSKQFPEWSISLNAKALPETCSYKFVVLDDATNQIVSWEWGEPRSLYTPRCMDRQMLMHSGMTYRFQEAPWKGSGVAIPVFSIRTENSWGCGDFADLNKMTDWAEQTGQQMIQLLPVNDTSLTDTWKDSYPYKAISVFALHPIYASMGALPLLQDEKKRMKYEKIRLDLNAKPEVDYESVCKLKWDFFQDLFLQEGSACLQTSDFQAFFEKNKDWLVPYAAFCYLRKSRGSSDFKDWDDYTIYHAQKIEALCHPDQIFYKDIAIHYYIQYQLHLQLSAARDYAHAHSVILKGDIPIGVCRQSVETWMDSRLFNMDAQVGAPPDAFSAKGQNWGFPSYHWDRMKAEDLNWWKRRFQKMADYFDAYRIDHILGFFRIWEIPMHSREGLLGHFSPALPLSPDEMQQKGFFFDEKSMINPFVTDDLIEKLFGKNAELVRKNYLRKKPDGCYELLPELNTQQKIHDQFSANKDVKKWIEGLSSLCNEVLFVRDKRAPYLYHPRILGSETACYASLDKQQQESFDQLYVDFFYHRNIDFWKAKAYEILPSLVNSTRMLVCGEDLGMIPSCVPEVMHHLGILSLEIQRMPKTLGLLFENLNAIPYQSVCTTSTHDMNPIRAWWQENPENTQQYFQQVLWEKGIAPSDCTPEIAEQIVRLHLESPALWVILPWQDWLSFDANLRHPDPTSERINDPSNPNQYWQYRMHGTMEALLRETAFNHKVKTMIQRAGR